MNDTDLHNKVMFDTALAQLQLYANEWEAAVDSGSIDAQLAVGRKMHSGINELVNRAAACS